jgi:serine beta-lactamase-like protein LACTB
VETVSRIGSVSKTITAVAIMQLEEAGKLKLDDAPQKYCAAFPQKQWSMSIAQVLSHLGGVRHYKSGEEFLNTKRYTNVSDAIAIFASDPLVHEPGTKYLYSSWGYNLLGCVVEGASGMGYQAYVMRNIGRDWQATRQDEVPSIVERRARYYSANQDGSLRNAPLADVSDRQAAGGWMSTTTEIAAFGNALLSGTLVSKATFETMSAAAKTKDGGVVPYGYGLVPIDSNGHKAVYHTGESVGASAILYMEPDSGLVIAMLWNKDGLGSARLKLAQDIAAAIHGAEVK